jgi:hypothetical protein
LYHSTWGAATGGFRSAEVVSTEWVRWAGNVVEKPGSREDFDDGLFEVCCQFLDERFFGDGVDVYGTGCTGCKSEEEQGLRGKRCACTAAVIGSGGWSDDLAYALGEGGRVELGAEDLVRAVGYDGDAPVADEGDQLLMLCGLDLGTEMFGVWNGGFSFDVDQDKIIVAPPEHGQSFGVAEGGVDMKS